LILILAGASMLIVRRTLTFVMIWLVLTTCFVCPVMQMLDRWDHEFQTGQDAESAFVVLALCIGTIFLVARTVDYISRARPVRTICSLRGLYRSLLDMLTRISAAAFLSASPPSAILRI
jgi:hypothetical protein